MALISRQWLDFVTPMATAAGCDPLMLAGIIQVESSGNPWAIRAEPGYPYLYQVDRFFRALALSRMTERWQQCISWGLTQLMGAVARERGCEEVYLSALLQPEVNITYALRHLVWLQTTKGYTGDWLIAAWNAGTPRQVGAKFRNQDYVDKVQKAMQAIDMLP